MLGVLGIHFIGRPSLLLEGKVDVRPKKSFSL